ncbi:MAG: TetR family transcriptional regulator [Anaerolineaceae bacterium]|nr:TetR family transcriptional regulator [Anaerolineaceae bacterium]
MNGAQIVTTSREQIIEKTCELLEIQGYHGTGLNQIVKESGSPKGSLYYYFPGGKEELAVEAIQQAGTMVLKRIRHNLSLVDDPAIAIREFIMNIAINVERSGYAKGGPITTIALETASSSEQLRAVCDQIYQDWQKAFSEKLQTVHLPERAASMSTLIIAAIEGGVILCRTSKSRNPLERIAEEIYFLVGS